MSTIASVGANSPTYEPAAPAKQVAAKPPVPAPATTDADHDGDTDGKGLDVKG